MTPATLVPAEFAVPAGLRTELFVLEPLGPESGDVIGCVYIYPLRRDGSEAWRLSTTPR
jgi:hypothetical protein